MKPVKSPASVIRLRLNFLLLLLGLVAGRGWAAVSFSVTPAAVSNTYPGVITLQISGIPAGDTVVIQKFLDLNANGLIDPNDWPVQQFQLTDGQAGMAIGGVVNSNVPGDLNTATGAVRATVNFQNGDFIQTIAGKYLFKLSSPAGHFSPLTNLFTVTNVPYGQKYTGNVVSNGTSTVVPNAVVVLFNSTRKGPLAGVVANNSGMYTLGMAPGTYSLVAFKSNFVCNFGAPPVVKLPAGTTVTTNLIVSNATASIMGSLVDLANPGLGLPSVFLHPQSTNGLMAMAFTDTNGHYTARVLPGPWSFRADDTSLIVRGYLGRQDSTNVNAGVTNVVIAAPRATALVYGTVRDTHGKPLAGIDVYVNDDAGAYETDGYTDAGGNYSVGVLGGDDSWYVEVSTDSTPTNYLFSSGEDLSLTSGQATEVDFTAYLATNRVSGWLKDTAGNPISGVGIQLSSPDSGNTLAESYTDSGGNYCLNVGNSNSWNISVENCSDCDSGLPAKYVSPASQVVNITNNNAVLNFTATIATTHITGNVRDSNGNPIAGLGIWGGATINGAGYYASGLTDGNGNYSMGVINGNWTVGLDGCCGNATLNAILGSGNFQYPNSDSVTVNNGGVANFVVELCGGIQILTTSLPDGQVNSLYDVWLSAADCNNYCNWSLNAGGNIPDGLNLESNGEIFGLPDSSGTWNFSVHADDGDGHSTDQNLSIYIAPAVTPLQVTTTWLPAGTNGIYYSQALQAGGGQGSYTWTLAPYSAALPANLTLGTDGVLSGTPATHGTFYFYARVTDAAANYADSSSPLQLNLVNPPLQIITLSLPCGTVGAGYTNQLAASGGYPPYTWSLATGSAPLPANLVLGNTGIISGIPATNGTFYILVQTWDSDNLSLTRPFTFVVNRKPVLAPGPWLTNRFQLWLTGATGQIYTIQVSTNLFSTNWTCLCVTNSSLTNCFLVTDPGASSAQRFYRVKTGP